MKTHTVAPKWRGVSALQLLWVTASALFCIGAELAAAQVINFDVAGGITGFTNYSGQGAYSHPGNNYWNPIVPNGTTTAGLLDDGSTSSPITLTVSSDSVYNAGGSQGTQGQPSGLQCPFYNASPGPKTCTLNNVPAGTYLLYLYGINGANPSGGFCNRGTTFTVNTNGTQWATSTTQNTSAAYNSFIQGNDYVVFQVQVGPGVGTITFTYQANSFVQISGSPNAVGNFNGLQLVTWKPASVIDGWSTSNAISTARLYKGVRTTPTTSYSDETAGGMLMGNGNLGVEVFGTISSQVYVLGKNDFFSQEQGQIKSMVYMTIAIPGMSSASYSMEQDIWDGEVSGTFTQSGNTITTSSWVQATDAVNNMLFTEFTYTGSGPQTVTLSFAPGTNNSFPTSLGSSGNVAYINVQADANASHVSIPSVFVRAASTVIGATPTVSSGSLSFTMQPGNTYTVATCVMSNYDNLNYQSAAINNINGMTQSTVNSLCQTNIGWWNNYFGQSFVVLGDKTVEKEFYASLYLAACESRVFQVAPGLWGNWIMEDTAWQGDYTLDYNFEAGIDFASATNHADMQQGYDAAILAWLPHGEMNATKNSFTGAYYEVHIGPMPWGSTESASSPTHGQSAPYENLKSNAIFAAMPMLTRYYNTHDLVYANEIFGYLLQVATFWQNYLTLSGGVYVDNNDARGEFAAYPQVNCDYELAFIRKLMQGCIDISTALNSNTSQIPAWQNIINNLSPYPTMTQNGQTVFSATSNPIFFWGNGALAQGIYPGDEIGLDSDSTTLSLALNTVNQLQNNGGWFGDHTPIYYPEAARVGFTASTILSKLDAFIAQQMHPGSLLLWSQSGGTENVNTVPATISEMLLQSCLGPIHVFPNWPSGTPATFGNLMARGGFLISSSISGGTVQYVRIISEQGQSALLVNPWPGQTLQVYRNGASSGTVGGSSFTLTTTAGETIHLAPAGTAYTQILSLMGPYSYPTTSLQILSASATVDDITYPAFPDGTGTELRSTAVGQQVTYVVPNVPAGNYTVQIGVKMHSDRGIWQLSIGNSGGGGQQNHGNPFDEYSATDSYQVVSIPVSFGTTNDKYFKFTITGQNASSQGFTAAFDDIVLVPTP